METPCPRPYEGRRKPPRRFEWLKEECGLNESGAEQAIEYIAAGRAILGAVPTQQTIIAERFFDESGGMQLVIHAPLGGRINKAWGLALRKRFCRSFNFELQAAATDNGLNISLGEQHSFPLHDVFHFLNAATVRSLTEQAVLASPIFTTRWRWAAGRALVLLRFQGGKKVAPYIQRMRSDDLLAAVFPDALACQENLSGDIVIPDHPLAREAMNDALTEAMDIEGLQNILEQIADGRIRCISVDTPVPSQFSHEILNANPYAYLDDAPLEERRARAVEMRRTLPESVLSEVGQLNPAAIAEVRAQAWPDVRNADELHDMLETLIALPELSPDVSASTWLQNTVGSSEASFRNVSVMRRSLCESIPGWMGFLEELIATGRASRAHVGERNYWVASEKAKSFAAIFPDVRFDSFVPEIESMAPSQEDAVSALLTGWMMHVGPTTSRELSELAGLCQAAVEKALLRLEAGGSVLRGNFENSVPGEVGWCDRRLLARIHQLTLGTLRRQIQPATAAQFMGWLVRWQHIAAGTQVHGEHGTLEILRQLQGFEAPANAWEREILSRRIAGYDPTVLDHLCLTGAVGWGRLSPHPATLAELSSLNRRVIPTSVAPIAFFVREDADWMISRRAADADKESSGLSPIACDILTFLKQRGASFFADLARGTGRLKSEVETALWELVAAGIITADGFDNIRALIDPKRRAGQGRGRSNRPRHSGGRWSLLYAAENSDRGQMLEATCRMLLQRYGVVFREVLARESIVPKWREILITLRRLEDRGEIRGGRFVSGFLGEQFALPVAVDSLRAMRQRTPAGEIAIISASDPLNLAGILVPGERTPANSGRVITLRDGIPVPTENVTVDISAVAAQ